MHCRKEFRTEQERPYWRGDITSEVTINRGSTVFVLGHWKINVFVFVFGKVCLTPSLLPLSTHIPALVVSESLQPLQCFPVRPGNVKLKPNGYIKGKGMSLYLIRWIAQSALSFTPCQCCSFRRQLDSLGSIHPHCNYCAMTVHSHTSASVYSQTLIYTTE